MDSLSLSLSLFFFLSLSFHFLLPSSFSLGKLGISLFCLGGGVTRSAYKADALWTLWSRDSKGINGSRRQQRMNQERLAGGEAKVEMGAIKIWLFNLT